MGTNFYLGVIGMGLRKNSFFKQKKIFSFPKNNKSFAKMSVSLVIMLLSSVVNDAF